MILDYPTYLRLQKDLQTWYLRQGYKACEDISIVKNKIYSHYINKFGSFVAINSLGNKQLFVNKKLYITRERKLFREFMDQTENGGNRYFSAFTKYRHKKHKKKQKEKEVADDEKA